MSERATAYAWVHKNMPTEERQALYRFTDLNPQLQGIPWWDAMEMLLDSDSHLDIIEPMVDEMGEEWGVLHSYVTFTIIYSSRIFATTWSNEMRVNALRATINNNNQEHTP